MAHQVDELKKNIASFQYANARLLKELQEADTLLRRVGFEEGLKTVKEAAEEILRQKNQNTDLDDFDNF